MEGILSFFSPCVFPLVPLYMAYLSSGIVLKDGNTIKNDQKKTFILTLCFIFGIYACFSMLALSVSTLNKYISGYRQIISLIGGIVLIVFGLNQVGILKINFLNRELRFDYRIENNKVNYLEAFMLGFVFSFAWTPCIGPMLSNAILLATQDALGSLYIVIYAVGLTLPFFIAGIFTSSVLKFINSHKSITKYVSIISGVIVLLFGIYMIYSSNTIKLNSNKSNENISVSEAKTDELLLPKNEFNSLSGKNISLYSDKMVVLHYSASWCSYCEDDEAYFEDFCNSHDELTCYIVMSDEVNNSRAGESTEEYFMKHQKGLEVLLDNDLTLYNYIQPTGFPFTLFTDGKGCSLGYIPGAVYDNYESIYQDNMSE